MCKQSFSILHAIVIFIHYKRKALFWNDLDLNQNPVLKSQLNDSTCNDLQLAQKHAAHKQNPIIWGRKQIKLYLLHLWNIFYNALLLAHELDNN